MTNEVLLNLLQKLLQNGELPSSKIAAGARDELIQWGRQRDCLDVEKSGRGLKVKVVNENILKSNSHRRSPNVTIDEFSPRLQNLAKNSDTKAGDTVLEY